MHTEIKICGLSTPETVAAAVDAGASHVGFVHFEPSPRHVELERIVELRSALPYSVKAVLLLVNADIETTARAVEVARPDVIQFHGSETPEWIGLVREKARIETWRAIGVRSAETLDKAAQYQSVADRLLFDAPPPEASTLPGGNGVGFDWRLLAHHDHAVPWGLAGGLNPENVADAIRATGAPLVDASSGLESAPGVKDVDRIAAFCHAARSARET